MPYVSKYHLPEQQAYALLGPIGASLRELERRAHHYVDRLAMEPAEAEAVRAAHQAISRARAEVERLWRASAPHHQG
jgi:7-keto-8-aminopelargonate synthetase-like enzyme